jgi:hypothetical protein
VRVDAFFQSRRLLVALSNALKDKLGFLGKKSVEKDIGGSKFRFYACRVPMIAELLACSGPIAEAITTLFTGMKEARSARSISKTIKDPTSGAEQITVDNDLPAATIEMLKFQDDRRAGAIKQLAETFAAKGSDSLLARFVVDSMREDFGPGTEDKDIEAFWNQLDVDSVFQFFAGALEANAEVIRPFLKKVGLNLQAETLVADLAAKVGPKLKKLAPMSEASAAPSSDSSPQPAAD